MVFHFALKSRIAAFHLVSDQVPFTWFTDSVFVALVVNDPRSCRAEIHHIEELEIYIQRRGVCWQTNRPRQCVKVFRCVLE